MDRDSSPLPGFNCPRLRSALIWCSHVTWDPTSQKTAKLWKRAVKNLLRGLLWGGTCTKPRPAPLVLAGGTLQLCLCPALCPDGLDPDPDLSPGLPIGAADLPCGYSSTGRWAAPITAPAQPRSPTSTLLPSPGITQIGNICKVLRKGWRVGVGQESLSGGTWLLPRSFSLWFQAKAVSSSCHMLICCEGVVTKYKSLGKGLKADEKANPTHNRV